MYRSPTPMSVAYCDQSAQSGSSPKNSTLPRSPPVVNIDDDDDFQSSRNRNANIAENPSSRTSTLNSPTHFNSKSSADSLSENPSTSTAHGPVLESRRAGLLARNGAVQSRESAEREVT